MQRRTFLRSLVAGAAGLAVGPVVSALDPDPERALWMPGRRTYFDVGEKFQGAELDAIWLDEIADEMEDLAFDQVLGGKLLTSDIIARETLAVLQKQMTLAGFVNRSYDTRFAEMCIGDAICIPERAFFRTPLVTVHAKHPVHADTARALQATVNHILREGV